MRPSISTATGDTGETGFLGKERAFKSDIRLHAIGSVDELNCLIGVVLSQDGLYEEIRDDLLNIQEILFNVGANLASVSQVNEINPFPKIAVSKLEECAFALEQDLPKLKSFILPGGSKAGALLHQSRSVCRRAERWIVRMKADYYVSEDVLIYMNRLSDYLFLAAMAVNAKENKNEVLWHGNKSNKAIGK